MFTLKIDIYLESGEGQFNDLHSGFPQSLSSSCSLSLRELWLTHRIPDQEPESCLHKPGDGPAVHTPLNTLGEQKAGHRHTAFSETFPNPCLFPQRLLLPNSICSTYSLICILYIINISFSEAIPMQKKKKKDLMRHRL